MTEQFDMWRNYYLQVLKNILHKTCSAILFELQAHAVLPSALVWL